MKITYGNWFKRVIFVFPFILAGLLGSTSQVIAADVEALSLESYRETKHQEKKKCRRSQSMHHLRDNLEQQQVNAELLNVKNLLNQLDELYSQIVIKVQKFDDKDIPGPETLTNLYNFLMGKHSARQIVKIIERDLDRRLLEKERLLLKKDLSLTDAIRVLYKNHVISDVKAHAMILENAPMTADEIFNLIDLGASHTKSGYLVNLRTGERFGDPIQLVADFNTIADRLLKIQGEENKLSIEDLMTHPLPDHLAAVVREFGTTSADTISDTRVINAIRGHFVFLSRINLPISFRPGTTDLRPNALMTTGAPVNTVESNGVVWALLKNLNAVLMNNRYFAGHNSSLTNSFMLAPFGATYWGAYNWTAGGVGWWLSYTDKYLGIGGSYTTNFAKGAFWSNGAPTYLMVGGSVSGWRNNISVGVSLMTMMSSTVGAGFSLTGTITRDHDVFYRGQYPLDGRFPEIRGLHKIEIDDRKGIALQESVAANFSNLNVPIMVAFRAGQEWTTHRVFRTHVDLQKTQRMLSEADVPGVLYLLGKKIKETKLPTFLRPDDFKVGDEFVETKTGKLSGAFVVGLQAQIPIAAVRGGVTGDFTAEFELGLRKLPGKFLEVSIEPKRIYEVGIFGSILNTLGAGYIASMSIARKQSFIFDFNNPEARTAYFALVKNGILPTAQEITIYPNERGPEYLLTEFREQNEYLKEKGIALNYIEHVQVSADKLHAGFNSRMLSGVVDLVNIADRHIRPQHGRLNLRFDGIDWEFMHAQGKSVASNGIISVRRTTDAYRKSRGQGFSGRYNRDIYVTHRRVHSRDEKSPELGHKWHFDSLLLHAQYEDNLITGNQENDMVEEINRSFGTFIGPFARSNSRQPRVVNLERELTLVDFQKLQRPEVRRRITHVSQSTNVSNRSVMALLDRLNGKDPDYQALELKEFISSQTGTSGFAAIHQLLGARPEDLHVRTEAGYNVAINGAKKFIANIADPKADFNEPKINLSPYKGRKNKRHIKKIYKLAQFHLGELDAQLRLLEDDQFLIDDDSELNQIYSKSRVDKLVKTGVWEDKKSRRVALSSARETIKNEFNLQKQNFTDKDIKNIYKMAGRKHLLFRDLGERLILKYGKKPLTTKMSKSDLCKRLGRVKDMVGKANDRIIRLKKDVVMIEMDSKYVNSSIEELTTLRTRLIGLVDMQHLNKQQLAIVERKVGKELFHEVSLYTVPTQEDEIDDSDESDSSTDSSFYDSSDDDFEPSDRSGGFRKTTVTFGFSKA